MHTIFVYGSLKQGFSNHMLLRNSEFLGKDHTLQKHDMFSFGAFPALVPNGNYFISGEAYEVDDATLNSLDRLESNGSFYQREEIALASGKLAWCYFIKEHDPRNLDDQRRIGRIPFNDGEMKEWQR